MCSTLVLWFISIAGVFLGRYGQMSTSQLVNHKQWDYPTHWVMGCLQDYGPGVAHRVWGTPIPLHHWKPHCSLKVISESFTHGTPCRVYSHLHWRQFCFSAVTVHLKTWGEYLWIIHRLLSPPTLEGFMGIMSLK